MSLHPSRFASALLLAALAHACDSHSSPVDASAFTDTAVRSEGGAAFDSGRLDGALERDAASSMDAGTSSMDASSEPDAGTSSPDAGTSSPDAWVADAGSTDPGPIQCRANADCPTMMCNRDAPGGICLGCGTDADCSGSLVCFVGACVRECSGDGDCNAGFRCTGGGRCALRSCSAATPCPAPYACGSSGRCARPTCAGGASCPVPLTCSAGVCVEP